jgi:internalin A
MRPNLRDLMQRHVLLFVGLCLVVALAGCGTTPDPTQRARISSSTAEISSTKSSVVSSAQSPSTPKTRAELIAKLKKAGCIAFEDDDPGKPVDHVNLSNSFATDADLRIIKLLKELKSINLNSTAVTDDCLCELFSEFYQLERLGLSDTRISDEGLKDLKKFKNLTQLELRHTKVTDAGLESLKDFEHLRWLDLSATKVTRKTVAELRDLKKLTDLNIGDTEWSDEDMKVLRPMTQLTGLVLASTNVTDVGISELTDLKQLRVLSLSATQVTDDVVETLKQLGELRVLYLGGTKLTNLGLDELAKLKHLTNVYVEGTKVTEEGAKRFKRALPECNIVRELVLPPGVPKPK